MFTFTRCQSGLVSVNGKPEGFHGSAFLPTTVGTLASTNTIINPPKTIISNGAEVILYKLKKHEINNKWQVLTTAVELCMAYGCTTTDIIPS